jgi:hypothetical protein
MLLSHKDILPVGRGERTLSHGFSVVSVLFTGLATSYPNCLPTPANELMKSNPTVVAASDFKSPPAATNASTLCRAFAARFNVCLIVAIASPPIASYHSGVAAELIRDEGT